MSDGVRRFEPIAILGYGCVLPGALDPEALWDLVDSGTCALDTVPPERWGVDVARFHMSAEDVGRGGEGAISDRGGFVHGFAARFDPQGFALNAALIASLDPLTQWLLYAGREALAQAGRDRRPQHFRHGGAIVGNLGYPTDGLVEVAETVRSGANIRQPLNRFNTGLPAQHLAAALGLDAGGFALDAACASSLYALRFACDRLACGDVDFMLAGAVNRIENLTLFGGFTALGALSPSGRSRPFHRDADGLVPAEGAALFVLKRLDVALADGDPIKAVIRGIGLSNDGRGKGFLVPSAAGQRAAMEAAYRSAGISPADVSLIECHATGTQLGDRTEIESTAATFAGTHDVPIGSLKSNLGHLVTASGGAGLIKLVEAMHHERRPPTLFADEPADVLAASPFRVLRNGEAWPCDGSRVAAISSFGFGGNNAHVILEEWRPRGRSFASNGATVNPASARSVAVVAIAARVADGESVEAFRSHLYAGQPRGDDAARATVVRLPAGPIRIAPHDLPRTLPQQLMALAVADDAIAQINPLPRDRTGVFAATQCDAETTRLSHRWRQRAAGSEDGAGETGMWPVTSASLLGAMPNMPANRINAQHDLRGASCCVFGEEQSGLHALRIAQRWIATGELDAAVVVSVDLCCEPVHAAVMRELPALADWRPGDGAVAFVLKAADIAQRDGDSVLALLELDGDAAVDGAEISKRTRATFGHAHAAAGMLDVAASVVAVADGILPPALEGTTVNARPWIGERSLRITRSSFAGPDVSVIVREDASRSSHRRRWVDGDVPAIWTYAGRSLAELTQAVEAGHRSNGARVAAASYRVALLGRPDQLETRRTEALGLLRDTHAGRASAVAPDGVYFGSGAPTGELAFVFTGASAAYPGMGRELLLALPELTEGVAQRFPGIDRRAAWIYRDGNSPAGDAVRLAATSYLSQAHALLLRDVLGLAPHCAIGLSSGETNALFALGAWDDMDALLHDVVESGMYERELAGEYATIRRHWERLGVRGDGWATWHLGAPLDEVSHAISGEPAVAVTIVNAPRSVVIAGERAACDRVVARFPGVATPIAVELACHTSAISEFAPTWRELHDRPTQPPAGVRFYGNAYNAAYALTRESVAEALTQQAVAMVDFPRTILQAWQDGVRTFVEIGPRDHCRVAIDEILADRPHTALALDDARTSSLDTALAVVAQLFAHGHAVNLERLQTLAPKDDICAERSARSVPAHWPPLPARRRAPRLPLAPISPAIKRSTLIDHAALPGLRLSREQLETLAAGRVSSILGPQFRGQDGFARQVRMPEPPLLLADRVVGLSGVPGRHGTGTIWTETDIGAGAWYVSEGRMPVGITIESGQADLLLISWLGADRLNRGERVYRLLGCDLEFCSDLPVVGETLRYAITVDRNASLGDVRMFFFHYDCTSAGSLRLRVRNGQAGFFNDAELAASAGLLWSPTDAGAGPPADAPHDPPAVSGAPSAFDLAAMTAFANGDLFRCFGAGFERAASHTRTPRMPSADRALLGEVVAFEPNGGPWGRGYLRAERTVSPDAWFFDGHFLNDPCMPGTLMLDAAFGALAFYLSALGYTIDRDGWRFEPVAQEVFRLKCRGQVRPESQRIVYELFVHDVLMEPEPIIHADVLATVDGLKAFHGRRLGLRLVPDFPLVRTDSDANGNRFDEAAMLACAIGHPADAFGPEFAAKFPLWRNVQRLPGPPILFMTRVREVIASEAADAAGTVVVAEYAFDANAWYFAENGAATMPFVVLLEAALQPCGWLTSYVGATAPATEILLLRNLDGDATQHAAIDAADGLLVTRAALISKFRSGSVTIVSFGVETRLGETLVFSGTTTFGVFPEAMLENQVGLPASDDEHAVFAAPSNIDADLRSGDARFFGLLRLAQGSLLMLDRLTGWWPERGSAKLGVARAEASVDPGAWMFKAHFFGDPVQPGSLGIEALIQLLQAAMLCSNLQQGMIRPRFETLASGETVTWRYRGQVVPSNGTVTTTVELTGVQRDEGGVTATAMGTLFVDGKKIYHLARFAVRLIDAGVDATPHIEEHTIDLERFPWLRDHAPTGVPVVPLADVIDRAIAAAAPLFPDARAIGVENVAMRGWLSLPQGRPVRLRTTARHVSAKRAGVTFEAWRDAPRAELSRFEIVADAEVVFAKDWPESPAPLTAIDAPNVHDGSGAAGRDFYRDGWLFHGAALEVIREARWDRLGLSGILDADPGPIGMRAVNPRLLDGLMQAMPHDGFALWAAGVTPDRTGFPSRVVSLLFHGPVPSTGAVRVEARYRGPADDAGRFQRVSLQSIDVDGRVWCSAEIVVVLVSRGRFSAIERADRRAFIQREHAFPPILSTSRVAAETGQRVTEIVARDVGEADFVRGGVATLYAASHLDARDLARIVAIKEHVAAELRVHPARVEVDAGVAYLKDDPSSAIDVSVVATADGWRVTSAGAKAIRA
jgi:acyl transferase domain-containing protein/3-hydroxymyristoyl/3-hydroxydecanoyl-(acyl carrier protein) dehydratase